MALAIGIWYFDFSIFDELFLNKKTDRRRFKMFSIES